MSIKHDEFQGRRLGLQSGRETDAREAATVVEPPEPGSESVGPGMFDLVRELRRTSEVNRYLMEQAKGLNEDKPIVAKGNGTTTATGLLDLPIYLVPSGYELVVTRWNVEAVGFSPAAPYSNAAGFLALFAGLQFPTALQGVGSMVDFLPNPPASGGAILPASVTDGATQAGLFRGGEQVSLHVQTGPASTDIYMRLQGILRLV